MRIFLDQDVPHNIRRYLTPHGHEVVTAFHQGWSELDNGNLLRAIEHAGFEVLITADQNLEYQQNLTNRKIALVVLGNKIGRMCRSTWQRLLQRSALPRPIAMPSSKCR